MNLRNLLFLVLAGTCSFASVSNASEPLRLQQAVSRTLSSNPVLAAESAQLQAVGARAAREGLSTPYVMGGELENFAGDGDLSGINGAEATLRISKVIELGGKRAARRAVGAAELGQQQNALDTARIELASVTTLRFIEVLADQQRLAYAQEQVVLAERTRREVATWVAAARNAESDLRAAEIALADAELEREHAEHELASARTTLAASWGAMTPDFESVAGDLQSLPPVEPFEVIAARLPMTPEQRASLLESEVIAARRTLAEAAGKPDINLSLGVRRLQAIGDQALVMSVSVPLGGRSRAAYSVAEADAQLTALQARREAERFERHQQLFEKYQELNHARTEADALRTRLLPKAEQALAFTRRGFEAGRFSYLSLAQAQKTLFDLRERAIEAAARYHTLLAEVERLSAVAQDITP